MNGEFEVTRIKRNKIKNSNAGQVKKMLGPSKEQLQMNKLKSFSPNQQTHTRFSMKIALYCSGQIFGHEDVMNNREHTTTVKCLSTEAYLFVINKNEFINKFCRDEKTWKMLSEMGLAMDDKIKKKIKQNKN